MTLKKLAALLTAFSFFNFSTSTVLLAGPRDDNRYFSYQPEISQAVYNPAKDVSHPAYELNHLIETQKQSKQLELNLRQVLRDQRPVLSEGQSMFTPVPTPKVPDQIKPQLKQPETNSIPQNLKAPLPEPGTSKNFISSVIRPITQALGWGLKGLSLAFKAFAGTIRTFVTKTWEVTKAALTAVIHAFKGQNVAVGPTATSSQQIPNNQELVRQRFQDAQNKLTDHQTSYGKLQEKISIIGQRVEVLKEEYKRLEVSDPLVEKALDSLGHPKSIQSLDNPLKNLQQKSLAIEEAITSHNFTQAENLLNEFDQKEPAYSKQAAFLTNAIKRKDAALLQQIKDIGAITKDPQQAPQAARQALDHLRHLFKQELITPQAYAPLRVALTKSLPLQMAEAEKIKTREDLANAKEAFVAMGEDFKEIGEGAAKGDYIERPTSWNILGQISFGLTPAGMAADGRDLMANIRKGDKLGILWAAIGFVPVIGDGIKTLARSSGIADGAVALRKAEPIKNLARGAVDFYVRADGAVIPAKAYRYISKANPQFEELMKTGFLKSVKGEPIYFSFGKYDSVYEAGDKLQLPKPADVRAEFDTLQVADNLMIPFGNHGKATHLEPLTQDFSTLGKGGGTQAITYQAIKVKRIVDLQTGEILKELP